MQYEEAVAEARRLVKRSEADQWRLAELTWGQVKAGKKYAEWARDVGFSAASSRRYALVWDKWADRSAERPSFADAIAEFVGAPAYGIERIERGVQNMPPARKAAVVQNLLADPEVQQIRQQQLREAGDPIAAADPVVPAGTSFGVEVNRIRSNVQDLRTQWGHLLARFPDEDVQRAAREIAADLREVLTALAAASPAPDFIPEDWR